jgi:YbgC/YbaW family acyl-CoA thioester hydrolase
MRFRVAMRDVDSVNIYYATYYEWMERAASEFFGRAGHPISGVFAAGFAIPVVHSSCTYLAPVGMDEILCVQSWVSDVGRSSFGITHRFVRASDDRPVAWGRVIHVWAKRPEMAAVTPPSWFQALAMARGGSGTKRRMP